MDLETLFAVLTSMVLLGVLIGASMLSIQDERAYKPCFVRLNAFYCSHCGTLYQAQCLEAECPQCSVHNERLRF